METECTFALGSISHFIPLLCRQDEKSMRLTSDDGLNLLIEKKIKLRISQVTSLSYCPNMIEGGDGQKLFRYTQHIGQVAFERYQSDRKIVEKRKKKTTNRTKWTATFLEIFVLCLKCVVKQYPTKTEKYLKTVWDGDEEADNENSVVNIIKFIQNAIGKAYLFFQTNFI